MLLASVFFSGFVLPIGEFTEPVRAIAYTLPVTHGIRLLQDLMLRGMTNQAWEFLALGVIALVTLVARLDPAAARDDPCLTIEPIDTARRRTTR